MTGPSISPVARRAADAVCVSLLVLITCALVFAFCHHLGPTPLPVSLEKKVEAHAIATAVDTSEINRLKRVAASAEQKRHVAELASRARDSAAKIEHAIADSLARVALVAQSAADSAAAWRAAYDARTTEADSLRASNAYKDSALVDARLQIAAVDSALTRSEGRAARADSLAAAAVRVVRSSGPPCRLLHFFGCPSRSVVAVGGVIVGAAAAVIVKGHIKVSAPSVSLR